MAVMAELMDVTTTWTSLLGVEELASAFRDAATQASKLSLLQKTAAGSSRMMNERNSRTISRGLVPKSFADMSNSLEFFTPQSEGPFAQFDQQSTYSVGASLPQPDGNPLATHMYVNDSGDKREVTLQVLYIASFGHARARKRLADKSMGKLQKAMAAHDPRCR
ncbi:MAG: hypothetical protein WKF96_17430 [Solirubrobacteraceae bacterium]